VSPPIPAPPGFDIAVCGSRTFLAERRSREELGREGFADPARWEGWLARGDEPGGRAATARRVLPSGRRLLLKKLHRGGLLGPLWRARFPGLRRLVANLELPVEARRRGVATPPPVALLLREGPPGLYQGWLAMEEIPGSIDLGRRFRSGDPPGSVALDAAMRVVRGMHDAGVEHPDLNLGNLLVREEGGRPPEAWVVDLDRARLHERPLSLALRRRSLRRLERSFMKLRHLERGAGWDGFRWWFELYAPQEPELRQELLRGGALAEFNLALHRLRWRG